MGGHSRDEGKQTKCPLTSNHTFLKADIIILQSLPSRSSQHPFTFSQVGTWRNFVTKNKGKKKVQIRPSHAHHLLQIPGIMAFCAYKDFCQSEHADVPSLPDSLLAVGSQSDGRHQATKA